MYLVIIIPCLNEEASIENVIKKIPNKFSNIDNHEIIVIDDGSTDKSVELSLKCGVRVVSHDITRGVGAAFQTGVQEALKAKADILINIDGDGQFDAEDISKLIDPIIKNEADFVTASRFKKKEIEPVMPLIKKWGNRRIASLVSMLTGLKFFDVSCGFRAYSRDALLSLNLFGEFTYTQETFLELVFKGFRIKEVPVVVRGVREHGTSRVAKSITKYALNTSKIIFRTFRDYRPLKFFFSIAVICFCFSLLLGSFFFGHYFVKGTFTPHLWAGMTSAFLFGTSILFSVTGLMADMLDRIRRNEDTILYFLKKEHFYGNTKSDNIINYQNDRSEL